ncbi:DUF4272 domain-containing protein [Prosthecobacter sp.]|uniref:DUF4272 domain-containing protein n=1 Tax=Prosthecobacter sp. TaxID=1965333 RepID=UPI003784D9E6
MESNEDLDEDPPLVPPTVERILHRAFCLSAVICRSFIDEPDNEHCANLQAAMKAWLHDMGAEGELELWEADCIQAPTGSLEPQVRINASWLAEGLVVLIWALDFHELPAHDKCVDPKEVTDSIDFLHPDAADILEEIELESAEEIEAEASKAFAVHWRLRQFQMDGRRLDFAKFAETAWFGPLNIEGIALEDGDLAINGMAISKASAEQLASAMSIARERHRAFNWLLGHAEIYSDVDPST